jgi:hypothetical protein
LTETIERPVYLYEDLLCDVFRVVVITCELVRDPVHHGSMPFDQRLEGTMVSGRGAGDQVRIRHHREASSASESWI